jgi:hypothetical protein
MRNLSLGVALLLGLALLSYAGLAALQPPVKAAPVALSRLRPQDIAARDRMAQIVAEVAARTAAETARKVVISRSRPQPPAPPQAQPQTQQVAVGEVAQKSVGR